MMINKNHKYVIGFFTMDNCVAILATAETMDEALATLDSCNEEAYINPMAMFNVLCRIEQGEFSKKMNINNLSEWYRNEWIIPKSYLNGY